MLIPLDEAKQYLRVDGDDENALIGNLLLTAKNLVMDVGRMDTEEELDDKADTNRTAVLFCLSYLYENRNTADYHKLTLNLRYMLFEQREDVI